jgi:hypothetical protein
MEFMAGDRLGRAIEKLNTALEAGAEAGERYWIADLGGALVAVAHALRLHLDAERRGAGALASAEESQVFPTMDRQVESLRLREADLLEIVDGLETELHNSLTQMRFLSKSERQREVCALRVLGQELREALESFQLDESRLVLEAANTEIGVGD